MDLIKWYSQADLVLQYAYARWHPQFHLGLYTAAVN